MAEAKLTMKDLETRIVALEAKIVELSTTRNRGPKSERTMTEDDARRIILGDMKATSHKDAAEKLGLSYGQIYSARGGYTFKKIMEEKLAKKSK